jgi:spermidine synthase
MPPRPVRKRTFHEAGQSLTLETRGDHVELMIGDVPILTSAALGTERDFGALAARFATRPDARTLIGGLGFGSTLRGALAALGPEARVLVVERLATIVKLGRGELAPLLEGALEDPRVTLLRKDVAAVIAHERDLDSILLDVDNGPEWASFPDNARLYDAPGLAAAMRALRPGGSYAVWSGYEADGFQADLRAAGFATSVILLREKGRVQARVYVGTKPARTEPPAARTPR